MGEEVWAIGVLSELGISNHGMGYGRTYPGDLSREISVDLSYGEISLLMAESTEVGRCNLLVFFIAFPHLLESLKTPLK